MSGFAHIDREIETIGRLRIESGSFFDLGLVDEVRTAKTAGGIAGDFRQFWEGQACHRSTPSSVMTTAVGRTQTRLREELLSKNRLARPRSRGDQVSEIVQVIDRRRSA